MTKPITAAEATKRWRAWRARLAKLEKLLALAKNEATTLDERRNAALAACGQIEENLLISNVDTLLEIGEEHGFK